MSSSAGGWTVTGASALGARHAHRGKGNQDAMRWEMVSHGPESFTILALSDGHGGSRYVRSEVGSQAAVEVACRVVAEELSGGLLSSSRSRLERRVRQELIPRIVAEWATVCLADLAGRPFTAEERHEAGDPLDRDPLVSYGATLLVALLGNRQSVVLQLGDGDCLVASSGGGSVSPLPDDARLTGGETTSLCLPDAVADFRVAVIGHIDPVMVILASDGYGVAFADPGWRETVTTDLLTQLRVNGASHVDRMLPGWLADSAAVGGDDTTLLVAYRQGERHPPVTASRRLAVPLVALMVGAALGVAVGWTVLAGALPLGDDQVVAGSAVTTAPGGASIPPGTSIAVPEPEPEPEPGPAAVAGGSGDGEDESRSAWVVASSGEVVEFRPDLDHPMPRMVVGPGTLAVPEAFVFSDGVLWSLAEGDLIADAERIEVESDGPEALVALDAESGFLWALTEQAARLVKIDPQDPTVCQMFDVAPEDEGSETPTPGAPAEAVQCRLTIDAGG